MVSLETAAGGSASAASLIGRIIVVDDSDLFGGDLEPSSILLPIILNQAIAIGCADSFGFVLRLRVRDHVADLFAGMHTDAVVNQFTGGERGARLNVVFLDLAAQDLLNDQQTRIDLPAFDLGEPRSVRAGVVGGSYFDVMGLRPVLGRLINATDDVPNAAGVAVLTHRFWTTALGSDPNVIGKTVRLSMRSATIISVLEPSVPYPTQTEIIGNVVMSPLHLSATMVTGRTHRMTEPFGRLAPGADLKAALIELRTVYGAILKEHPEAYPQKSNFQIDAKLLRDQITSRAKPALLLLLAASALIFVIACSNVANLVLARSVRREGELVIRAALGALVFPAATA